jgi:hypothetical protein
MAPPRYLPHGPAASQPIFYALIVGPTADQIAHGDFDRFTTMLNQCGGLVQVHCWQVVPWSIWGFQGWWDCRHFCDYLIDFFWDPAAPEAAFFLREVAELEAVAA